MQWFFDHPNAAFVSWCFDNKSEVVTLLHHIYLLHKADARIARDNDDNVKLIVEQVLAQVGKVPDTSQSHLDEIANLKQTHFEELQNLKRAHADAIVQASNDLRQTLDERNAQLAKLVVDHQRVLEVKDTALQAAVQQRNNEVDTFIRQFTSAGSAQKGKTAEKSYEQLLNAILPDAEISYCAHTTSASDLLVKFADNEILVEVKNYKNNVPSKEVDKFQRDLVTRRCHGIMCSVTSGIARRKHMQITIVDGRYVGVFLPQHQHCGETIQMAINILTLTAWSSLLLPPSTLSLTSNATNDKEFTSLTKEQCRSICHQLEKIVNRDKGMIEQLRNVILKLQETSLKDIMDLLQNNRGRCHQL